MKIGPQFKLARRLGAPIFEKCQSPKFIKSAEKKSRTKRNPRAKSGYALQFLEKQKARFSYNISEKQFRKYVDVALSSHGVSPAEALYRSLESRLDNLVFKMGISDSRRMARQLVSHGHIYVNGRRVTIPSFTVAIGDIISIKPSSQERTFIAKKTTFRNLAPGWITFDEKKFQGSMIAKPLFEPTELLFDLSKVLEFYSR